MRSVGQHTAYREPDRHLVTAKNQDSLTARAAVVEPAELNGHTVVRAIRVMVTVVSGSDPRRCQGQAERDEGNCHTCRSASGHGTDGFRSTMPPPPWGHPDFVLARAAAEGAITSAEAELIGATRLEVCRWPTRRPSAT